MIWTEVDISGHTNTVKATSTTALIQHQHQQQLQRQHHHKGGMMNRLGVVHDAFLTICDTPLSSTNT